MLKVVHRGRRSQGSVPVSDETEVSENRDEAGSGSTSIYILKLMHVPTKALMKFQWAVKGLLEFDRP